MSQANKVLTFSTSHTLTVLSSEDVAIQGLCGEKQASEISSECSSRTPLSSPKSVDHKLACIINLPGKEVGIFASGQIVLTKGQWYPQAQEKA